MVVVGMFFPTEIFFHRPTEIIASSGVFCRRKCLTKGIICGISKLKTKGLNMICSECGKECETELVNVGFGRSDCMGSIVSDNRFMWKSLCCDAEAVEEEE